MIHKILMLILFSGTFIYSQWIDNPGYKQKATELSLLSITSLHIHEERVMVNGSNATGSYSLLYSDDDGSTWTEAIYGDKTISMTVFASISADTIFTYGSSIFGTKAMHISTDKGNTWTKLDGDFSVLPLFFVPSEMAGNSERIILTGLDNNNGVVMTEDHGKTWSTLDVFGTEGNRVNINALLEVNNEFFAAGEGFYKANFDSMKWSLVNNLEVLDAVYENDKFYGSDVKIFESSDFGVNWTDHEILGSNLGERITIIGDKLFVSIAEAGNPRVVMFTNLADEVDITEGLTDYSQSSRILKWVNNSASIYAIRSTSTSLWQYKFSGATAIDDDSQVTEFQLFQNYPNPFNPATTITFSIPDINIYQSGSSNVVLKIYNLLGETVAELINENLAAGVHTVDFDASNLNSGIYFYELKTGNFLSTKKMILLK